MGAEAGREETVNEDGGSRELHGGGAVGDLKYALGEYVKCEAVGRE